jgi:hypothetical protein
VSLLTEDRRARAAREVAPWEMVVQALPAVAFLLTFGLFFVDKNRQARSVLESGRGLLTVAVIVVGYVVIGVLLRRLAGARWVAPVVLAGVVLGLAAWIVRPYYVDETADRRLVADPVQEAAPPAPAAPAQAAPAEAAPPPAPAGPVRLSQGSIVGLGGHDASGTISVLRTPEGTSVVRFEGFDIEGVPDPRVYVVQGRDVRRPGGVELGRLRGNRGQVLDYALPAGTDAGPGWTVLVWCRAFSVPVAHATQT